MRVRYLIAFLLLAGCQQNPYKGRPGVQAPTIKKEEKPKVEPTGAYALVVPDMMAFTEGVRTEVEIIGSVPTPGNIRFVVNGLPSGMVFDPQTNKLIWTPDFQAANDPQDPTVRTRFYNIEVQLFSTADALTSLTKTAVLQVKDTPQPLNIKSALSIAGSEGQPITHVIEFEDLEFPTGPFEALIEGFPAGTKLEWPDHKIPRFQITWQPDFNAVRGRAQEILGGKVALHNPRGRRLEFQTQWTIANVVAPPRVAGPSDIDQGPSVDFIVIAEDVNNEDPPQWKVVNGPTEGDFRVQNETLSGGPLPRSMGVVTWKRIPRNKLGSPVTVDLQACVKSTSCTNHQVRVQANASAGVAP